MAELTGTYDPTLVAVSIAVVILSCFVALSIAPRIHCASNTKWDTVWSVVTGMSLGTGIWSMHFIAMLGFKLPVHVHYDISLITLSLLLAIMVFSVAVFPIREGGSISRAKIILLGLWVGCGIAGMHYLSMAAMRMHAGMHFAPGIVGLTIFIAIAAAITALMIINHLRAVSIFARFRVKFAAATAIGLGASLMHFTAMHGVSFYAQDTIISLEEHLDTQVLSITLVAVVLLIQGGTLLVALLDEAYFSAKASERLANQRSEMDQALFSVLAVALQHRSLDDIMHRILKILLDISWLSLEKKGSVFIADADSSSLRMVAHHQLGDDLLNMCGNISFGTCLCGQAAQTQQIVHRSCIDADHVHRPASMTPHGHYCVPILDEQTTLGVLNLYVSHGHVQSSLEIQLLESVSNAMAGIIKRKMMEEQLQTMSYQDELTGLANRRKFLQTFEHALVVAKRSQASVILMTLDLDHFKPVNDTFGHDVGDILLKQVASRVTKCLRDMDTFARVGGDEFMILLELMHTPAMIEKIGQRVLNELNRPFDIQGHQVCIGGSIGVGIYPEDGETCDELIKQADISLYKAKETRGTIHQNGNTPKAA